MNRSDKRVKFERFMNKRQTEADRRRLSEVQVKFDGTIFFIIIFSYFDRDGVLIRY